MEALTTTTSTPGQLLEMAINKDLDIEKLKELMVMQREWKADIARKSFFDALMQFQNDVPEIRKNKSVNFESRGAKVNYNYAQLADIVRQIRTACKDNGITYRWEIDDKDANISVTCLVTHSEGHTERTTMTATADDSGGKNKIQARGSTIEYLKRYTLIGALGLSTTDTDTDGLGPEIDLDILHQQYMRHYNELIQIDSQFTRWHPDQWKSEPTRALYIKAIGEIRKKLADLTPKKA
jgi:hypothetical protein